MTKSASDSIRSIEQVMEIERRWAKLLLAGNVDEMACLMAEEFYLITPLGSVLNKNDVLEMIRSKKCVFNEIIVLDSQAQAYSECVLVQRSWHLKARIENLILDGRSVFSALWVQSPEGFKIRMAHASDSRLIDNWTRRTGLRK